MFIARIHFVCRVTDRNGLEDMLDVTDLELVPSKWVKCEVLREYVE